MVTRIFARLRAWKFQFLLCQAAAWSLAGMVGPSAPAQQLTGATGAVGPQEQIAALPPSFGEAAPANVVHKIRAASEKLEMTANTSRIVKLDQKIPRAQVNNKDLLDLTPLSPNEVQIFAKKPGVTQVNLWDESNNITTLDVIIYGDARELEQVLAQQYPNSSIRVRPIANSVILTGFVDSQEQVSGIIRIAEDYYPKVIPNITVGGVQQIALHVKVMEVSRTKLRTLGMDWSFSNGSDFVVSGVSGLISATAAQAGTATAAGDTIRFGFVDGNNSFFAFLQALRQYKLIKVLAEPTLITVSGRPAFFNAGGEFPVLVPQSLGTVSIQYKKYGTQVDFVPIVLGNGTIRLEVRPRISEIDSTRSVTINGTTVPGLRVREVDTGVEMKAGQTLALAGLVQSRVESDSRGIPWLADLPYLGVPFRRNAEEINEVELLILVTPQFVNGVDASEVPPCGPGMSSTSPADCDFYFRGYMEVPNCGPCAPGSNCDDGQFLQPTTNQVILPGMPSGPTVAPSTKAEDLPPGTSSAVRGVGNVPSSPYLATPANGVPQTASRPVRPAEAARGELIGTRAVPGRSAAPTTRPGSNSGGLIGPIGYDE
ncbi:MAG: pilus assembly protein N-terminal domain-containing protein [Pirellulales bacterium]|nr:pilus assembly protein N-terminal domain-containing protein [Pirellulales bacterium]